MIRARCPPPVATARGGCAARFCLACLRFFFYRRAGLATRPTRPRSIPTSACGCDANCARLTGNACAQPVRRAVQSNPRRRFRPTMSLAGPYRVRQPFIRRTPPGPVVERMEAGPHMSRPDRSLGGSCSPKRNESNCVGNCASSARLGAPLRRRSPPAAGRLSHDNRRRFIAHHLPGTRSQLLRARRIGRACYGRSRDASGHRVLA